MSRSASDSEHVARSERGWVVARAALAAAGPDGLNPRTLYVVIEDAGAVAHETAYALVNEKIRVGEIVERVGGRLLDQRRYALAEDDGGMGPRR